MTADDPTLITTLANGVRVLVLRLPARPTVDVSVFVHTGSQNESPREAGISHVVEHMAFKGTTTRDCQRINLDAEALGAQVNAHTDKDHSAFHMFGLRGDAAAFVAMLADIVRHRTFPADELEREAVARDEQAGLPRAGDRLPHALNHLQVGAGGSRCRRGREDSHDTSPSFNEGGG